MGYGIWHFIMHAPVQTTDSGVVVVIFFPQQMWSTH